MSTTVKTLLALSLVAFVAACGSTADDEIIIDVVEPEETSNKL